MTEIQKKILMEIADISGTADVANGAYNIRVDGKSAGRSSTAGVSISPKPEGTGLDIVVTPGAKEKIHIPVVVSADDHREEVLNDFIIGEGADVTIIAGCGIHNCGSGRSQHDGVHSFVVKPGAHVKYIEKHIGAGDGTGERVLNPVTNIVIESGGTMEMDTIQIRGVDSTRRITRAVLAEDASLIIHEKLMTHGTQTAETVFEVEMNGEDCGANVVSRSVARDSSKQVFLSKINGSNRCAGHSECDAIIMDSATVQAIPEITANHTEASLIHEAAIGKIAGEQLIKLMTLGLTETEAEEQIINGFLK